MMRDLRRVGMTLLIVGIGLAAVARGAAEEILLLGRLGPAARPDQLPDLWRPLTFTGIAARTRYGIVRDGEEYVLRAESRAAASGLMRPLDLDPRVYPMFAWRWKVENILVQGDAGGKAGDDYPARLYVAFGFPPAQARVWEWTRDGVHRLLYGASPPDRAINYIWANRLPRGEAIASPYTARDIMVAVQSGPEHIGRWMQEERNVYEDYRRLFGQEPPRIVGVALMTDTDDTGESAVAYYDGIRFRTVK